MARLVRSLLLKLAQLPLLVIAPLGVFIAALALLIADAWAKLFVKKDTPRNTAPRRDAASVVIPNWNGRDLLEKYVPSILTALEGNDANELIVVDNASSDGSVEFLRTHFPRVRVLALERNYGFGGGSNRGITAASNDIVVLLNSDMRVAPDFLAPLLAGFDGDDVFAVSCQIFFSDPNKPRQETGLTECWWHRGRLRARHRADANVDTLWPCFYGGGGSTAYDRKKFLELGGFDELLAPFYMEDSDLGLMAWKRGWRTLYQPASHVWHEHRGTIGKNFSRTYIDSIIGKNAILFAWKNAHSPSRLLAHFVWTTLGCAYSWLVGNSLDRASLAALARAFFQLPGAMRSRVHARRLAVVDEAEAFFRSTPVAYHDYYSHFDAQPARPSVLFLCPYQLWPPVHGGAISILGTVKHLAAHADVHLIVVCETPEQQRDQLELLNIVSSVTTHLRRPSPRPSLGSTLPHAVREFADDDLAWILHREILKRRVDIVQLEYTNIGYYHVDGCRNVAWILFEHDIYFQSVASRVETLAGTARMQAFYEYLRALRFELRTLRRMDRVQVCTPDNRDYLLGFAPELASKIDCDVRAGMDLSRFPLQLDGREPYTMLFLGSFRHLPNLEALTWFLDHVMPHVLRRTPQATLRVIGSHPPAPGVLKEYDGAVRLDGFVEDLAEPLARTAVFICPILGGSGVRMKLQEAFAAGIPSVSTTLGAEGLCAEDGLYCRLADAPEEFARVICETFEDAARAAQMAARARDFIEASRGLTGMTARLMASYRQALSRRV